MKNPPAANGGSSMHGPNRKWPKLRALAAIAAAVFMTACGSSETDYQIDPGAVLAAKPLIEPLPLTVGVYYGAEFRNFETVHTRRVRDSIDHYHLRLGRPSMALFNLAFGALFAETVVLSAAPPWGDGGRQLQATIAPRIESASLSSVRYAFKLTGANGRVIADWNVAGQHTGETSSERTVAHSIRFAMRDAAADFLIGFQEEREVRAWLARLEIVVPNAPPGPHGP
jgi:hypothetical protein